MKNLKKALQEIKEEKPGLWANIRAKRERGEKPAHKNSNAHKDAVAAGQKINKMSEDKADAVRWFGNLKYYYQKAFAELKGEDRETYKQLAKDFFSKLEIDQHVRPVGLSEANVNPEAEKLVGNFIMKLAKRYGYGAKDAIYLIQSVISNIEASGKLNEGEDWPEEVPSRHGDIIFKLIKVMPDRAKYALIDAETGKEWESGGRVFTSIKSLMASAEDTIMPQGGRQSSQF